MASMPGDTLYEFTYSGFPTWHATEYVHWHEKPWQEIRATRHDRFWDARTEMLNDV